MNGSLIVQGDGSLLLDVHTPGFEEARSDISCFAELEKSPEHFHTYRITAISLWNAASAGLSDETIFSSLKKHSRYPIPPNVLKNISDILSRYGKIILREAEDPRDLLLEVVDDKLALEISHQKKLSSYLRNHPKGFLVSLLDRGIVKLELIKLGYPVDDLVPLVQGDPLDISLKEIMLSGRSLNIRDYQKDAVKAFTGDFKPGTGFGTVVMPCGSGKTVMAMTAMAELKTKTLIITTNIAAVHQWRDELLDKTSLTAEDIGEYTGENKEIKPVTIATYQILVWRKDKTSPFPHFEIFRQAKWGLIVYDEVHLLPAPVFRVTAEIQAIRRLGLTATLVREDGAEDQVFTLVGPKRYDVPWKYLEEKGWIAEAYCTEIRIDLPENLKVPYAVANRRAKYRLAAENPDKIAIINELLGKHTEDSVLIIGQYIDQLNAIAEDLNVPLITGKTPNDRREEIYSAFKKGDSKVIVVSKVANFAIDLPDASVAIQVSGSFGSRQEEAQRLGRILRPKEKSSHFYSLVSRYTVEEEYGANRQKFLTEQGYKYNIDIRSHSA